MKRKKFNESIKNKLKFEGEYLNGKKRKRKKKW